MKYFGIDLGTNNSIIASLNNDTLQIEGIKGSNNIKTIVRMDSLSEVSIGDTEIESLKNSLFRIKGKLADDKFIEFNNGKVSVQYCMALVLAYLRNKAEQVKDIVLTIPSFYNQSKRNATIESARQAGFNNIKLIEEPSAAAMFHIYNSYKNGMGNINLSSKNIFVFDFGGGTLDLSLVEITLDEKNKIKPNVKRIAGLQNFGGYYIDILLTQALINIALNNEENLDKKNMLIKIQTNLNNHINSYEDNNNDELLRLDEDSNKCLYKFLKEAERIKIELSKADRVMINVEGFIEESELLREDFEEYILRKKLIIKKIEEILNEFKTINNEKIDEVILVGGTARIPLIIDTVKENFVNSIMFTDEIYVQAVALGSAIISALWQGHDVEPFGSNVCKGVMPRNINLLFNNIEFECIKAGTGYPLKESIEIVLKIPFSLSKNITINIYEEWDNKKKNICNTSFYHPCFFTGDEIKFIIDIDENGLLKFNAIHNDTQEEIEFYSKKENELSINQINNGRKQILEKVKFMEE